MFLPVNLNLKGRNCLVVGAGSVAEKKISSLLSTGAKIFVVARAISPSIEKLKGKKFLRLFKREFRPDDLKNKFLVIVATHNKKVNNSIANLCRGRNIIVNSVDSVKNSDFIFPAYFSRGDLVVAISTNGKSPTLAVKIRNDLKKYFGNEFKGFVREVGYLRRYIMREIKSEQNRKYLMSKMLEEVNMLKLTKNKSINVVREKFRQLIKNHARTGFRAKS